MAPPFDDEHIAPPATLADLTPRQRDVARLVAQAKPDKQIAFELHICERRVRFHIAALAYVLHLDPTRNTRIQVALWWRERCPISLSADVA